jgi:hypothetical protein
VTKANHFFFLAAKVLIWFRNFANTYRLESSVDRDASQGVSEENDKISCQVFDGDGKLATAAVLSFFPQDFRLLPFFLALFFGSQGLEMLYQIRKKGLNRSHFGGLIYSPD